MLKYNVPKSIIKQSTPRKNQNNYLGAVPEGIAKLGVVLDGHGINDSSNLNKYWVATFICIL